MLNYLLCVSSLAQLPNVCVFSHESILDVSLSIVQLGLQSNLLQMKLVVTTNGDSFAIHEKHMLLSQSPLLKNWVLKDLVLALTFLKIK